MSVIFIINDLADSIYGRRIRNFTKYFIKITNYRILYRDNNAKFKSIFRFLCEIIKYKPKVIYVEQIAFSGCLAVAIGKFFARFKYIFCVSDAYAELIKSNHNKIISFIAKALERWWLNSADYILTCNPLHALLIKEEIKLKDVDYIEHGVDTDIFNPQDQQELRLQLGLADALIVGLVGSLVWSKRYRFSYGWDIIEAMVKLKDLNIKAIIVGDGTGSPHLKQRIRELNLEDKVILTGNIIPEKIPAYINCMDICISTQSNDSVGYVRCPTKLSEYMACGKYIISSDVGYAKLYVDKVGKLLRYFGVKDNSYPERLAEYIRYLYFHRIELEKGKKGIAIVQEFLDNKKLSQKLEEILLNLLSDRIK